MLIRFCVGDRYYLLDGRVLCEYDYEERVHLLTTATGASTPSPQSPSFPACPPPPGPVVAWHHRESLAPFGQHQPYSGAPPASRLHGNQCREAHPQCRGTPAFPAGGDTRAAECRLRQSVLLPVGERRKFNVAPLADDMSSGYGSPSPNSL